MKVSDFFIAFCSSNIFADKLHNLLEASFKLFGDKMYINHTPILQQEGKPSHSFNLNSSDHASPCPNPHDS